MNYFEKIEAYVDQQLSPVERQLFEAALAENTLLQEELEAYELAESLFNFSAEHISEADLLEAVALDSTEALIDFTASHLSEAEILAAPKFFAAPIESSVVEKTATIRFLSPTFRKALAAASVLLIVGLFGIQFTKESTKNIAGENNAVATIVEEEKPTISIPSVESTVAEKIEKEDIINETVIKEKVLKKVKKYEPAKVKIRQPKTTLAASTLTSNTPNKLLAVNTSATTIVTSATIAKGQTVTYQAEEIITLEPGFHAEAGASFIAMSTKKSVEKDIIVSEVMGAEKSKTIIASNSITFDSGFYVKAGTDFTAISSKSNTKDIITNVNISAKESMVFNAENSVTLTAGFHAKAGADFTAMVEK